MTHEVEIPADEHLNKGSESSHQMEENINKILFDTIFNNSNLGIAVESIEGMIINANPAFIKMLGYSKNELLNLSFGDVIHPHDSKTGRKLFDELISQKKSQYSVDIRLITKSGGVFYAGISGYIINSESDSNHILTLVQDLSDHNKIINELKSNQNLFSALLNNSSDSIYFKDLQGKFIKVNWAVAKAHNQPSPYKLIGKTDFDLFGKEHASESYNDEQQIIRSGEPLVGKEERILWPDGTTSWISSSKMPYFDESGNIVGIVGITRDITKTKLTEEALLNERIMMRTILDNLPDAIYTKDLECKKTFINKRDLENLGCSKESEALGKTDFDFFSEDIASAFYADDLSVISSGKPIINREELLCDEHGNEKWLLTSKLPLRNDEDKIVGLVGIGHDITSKRKSEKIREALYLISESANTTSDMLMLYKRLHEIIQTLIPVKNFYISLYDDKTDLISFPYFVDEKIRSMPTRKIGNGLNGYVVKNGQALLLESDQIEELKKLGKISITHTPAAIWLGVPLKLEGKSLGTIVIRDYNNSKAYNQDDLQLLSFVSSQIAQVIERRRSSDAIAKYTEELKQLNQTKDKFFSIIAHDLKNPFITILGFSELLLSDYNELSDEERIFYIDMMKKSAESSHNLLQNLLQWSRSQSGRIDFNPADISIDSMIQQNIDLLTPTADKKNIRIEFDNSQPMTVFADKDMVDTITRNLISNAIKFTNREGKIVIETSDVGNFVKISVKDTGIGMTEEDRNNLFRLDISKSSSGTEQESGTGLGLIICKEFVEKNNGSIFVESTVGQGSTFHFTLPKPKQ